MNLCRLISLLLTFLAFLPLSNILSKTYQIDTKRSTIKWMGSKKIGEGHQGTLKFKEGSIQSSNKSFQGTLVVNLNTIVCDDIKDPKKNAKLVKHLKSKDFFYVDKYKTANFVIENMKKDKETHIVSGEITIRGKTAKIVFPVHIQSKDNSFHAKGVFKIDRTKFNVKYNSGKFYKFLGDKLINDDFILDFEIFSKK